MKKRSDEPTITNIVIPIIIFVIIIVFLFFLLKAFAYSGRLQAKFGYALAGSISFLVNKPAQIVQSYSEDGLFVLAGIVAAAALIGGVSALRNAGISAEESAEVEDIIGEPGPDEWYYWYDNNIGNANPSGSALKTFAEGAFNGLTKVVGNPIYQSSLLGLGTIFAISSITNTIASDIQGPILQYLAPEGVIFVDFNDVTSNDLNQMYDDLNSTFVQQIQNDCNNPQNSSCENIFLTYLIAKYLYYTWGETLGQSVAIAGSHGEYFIGFVNYNSTNYNLTQEGVLCMLGMMDFYGKSPLKQMYNMNLTQLFDNNINYDNDLVCQIAANVLFGNSQSLSNSGYYCGSTDANIPNIVTQMDVFESYNISNNNINQYSCSNGETPNDYNILIPSGDYNGSIQYLYDGGTQSVIVSILFGNS